MPATNATVLLLETLGGALYFRLFVKSGRVDDVIIARVVDLLLLGAVPRPTAKVRRARP